MLETYCGGKEEYGPSLQQVFHAVGNQNVVPFLCEDGTMVIKKLKQ